MCAHAGPRLTVGLLGRAWPTLDVLLQELSHLLGEAGVATELGSWAPGPEGGFILRLGSPFSSPPRSPGHRELRILAVPGLPTFLRPQHPCLVCRPPVPASCVVLAWSYSRS